MIDVHHELLAAVLAEPDVRSTAEQRAAPWLRRGPLDGEALAGALVAGHVLLAERDRRLRFAFPAC